MTAVATARRLAELRPQFPVVSLYFDLDPERFATAPARASQARSLIDQAAREVEQNGALGHQERLALREDLERLRRYLLSREPPFQGARALAVFCSSRDDLFEVIQLARRVEGRVVVERAPYVEPLVLGPRPRRWCVALVNRRDALIYSGPPDQLSPRERIEDDVHGQHDQGGLSQARYQRSVDQDAENHLRHVADELYRVWRQQRFGVLALGGPQEVVPRFEELLHDELRARLAPHRVQVDMSSATEEEVRSAVGKVIEESDRARERDALDRLSEALGAGGRAAGGPEETLDALNQRRVQTLLLENGIDRSGGRCPKCGLLTLESEGSCPADGTPLKEVEHLREAMVEAALMQDVEVIVVERYPDLGPHRGIAALLRF